MLQLRKEQKKIIKVKNMAQKKFKLTQKVNLNGVIKTVYSSIVCDETEIASFLAHLEGEYTVMVEHSSGGSDAVVASYNLLERVTYGAEGKANMRGGIYASGTGLAIKNSSNADEVSTTLSAMHLFEDDSTKKPSATSIRPVITQGAVAAAV